MRIVALKRRIVTLTALSLMTAGIMYTQTVTAQNTKEVNKTVALNADGRVSIQAFKGSIKVTGWDRAEVEIQAIIEPDGRSRSREEAVEYTEVRIDDGRGTVYIESDYDDVQRNYRDDGWDWCSDNVTLPFIHYTISIPRGARLDISDHKSEIEVSGLQSEVRINSHKGPMVLSDITGDLRLETHKSRVRVTGLAGSLDLDTHEAEVDVQFVRLGERTRIETHKGEINITIPKGAGFELDADVGRKGELRADFDLRDLEYRFGRRDEDLEYRGDVNGGGPLLRLRTYKGYYRIRER